MQLEPEQRRLVNRAVTQARFFERQQLTTQAKQLRAEIAQERASMLAELATLKANMIGEYAAMKEELAILRQYYQAHRAYGTAKQEVVATYRRHTIERAMEAARDPTAPLH
ncbi:MAG TPA: hypothetical protein VKG24_15775 [Pseudolabrys sp.]|nr:hypothetical protein [Pseudolabrys sp.]